jgi:hypothetical protein
VATRTGIYASSATRRQRVWRLRRRRLRALTRTPGGALFAWSPPVALAALLLERTLG